MTCAPCEKWPPKSSQISENVRRLCCSCVARVALLSYSGDTVPQLSCCGNGNKSSPSLWPRSQNLCLLIQLSSYHRIPTIATPGIGRFLSWVLWLVPYWHSGCFQTGQCGFNLEQTHILVRDTFEEQGRKQKRRWKLWWRHRVYQSSETV